MVKNKSVFLITGGGGRIGSSLAKKLLEFDSRLIIGEKDILKIKKLKKQIHKKNLKNCFFFHKDLTKINNIKKLIFLVSNHLVLKIPA